MPVSTPVFINCRDRVTDLRRLVEWLEAAGEQNITLIDNASTWEPLLAYYEETPHRVIRLTRNLGARSLWDLEAVPSVPFIYTDPDLIPIEECPLDAMDRLREINDRYEQPKVGFGLYLDDLPEDFEHRVWEESLVSDQRRLEPGVYNSLIDTTFALHKPGFPWSYDAIRLGFPYQMRHTSWYATDLDDESQHYLSNAIAGPQGSSWAQGRVS